MIILNNQDKKEIYNLTYERAIGIAFSDEVARAYIEKGYACIQVSKEDGAGYDADFLVYDEDEIDEDMIEHVYNRHYKICCKVLETERTFVREIGVDDYDALKALYDYPEVTEFLEPLFDKEKELQYQRDYYDNIYSFYDFGMWGVFNKETGKLIGRCGIDPHEHGIELGYIISPEYHRQGFAYEVCLAIIEYAKEIGIPELLVKVDNENIASVALAKKLGFEFLENDFYKLNL